METHAIPELHTQDAIMAIIVAIVFILVSSLLREPNRQNLMAIMVSGAGAAYLNGGLGLWEFAFTAIVTFCAYKGLQSYSFIGFGWMLHTIWDVIHHFYGNPIIPFISTSSAQCAITDTLIAVWFFANAPSVFDYFQHRGSERGRAYEDPADHDRP
jgi:hypothetical protein